MFVFFFFNDTATTEIYTLSLHDALPICIGGLIAIALAGYAAHVPALATLHGLLLIGVPLATLLTLVSRRSEEHTSELQSRQYLVCRLLLEKKKKTRSTYSHSIYLYT